MTGASYTRYTVSATLSHTITWCLEVIPSRWSRCISGTSDILLINAASCLLKRRTWKSIPSDMWRGHLIKQDRQIPEFNDTALPSYSTLQEERTTKPRAPDRPLCSWHLSARGDEILTLSNGQEINKYHIYMDKLQLGNFSVFLIAKSLSPSAAGN